MSQDGGFCPIEVEGKSCGGVVREVSVEQVSRPDFRGEVHRGKCLLCGAKLKREEGWRSIPHEEIAALNCLVCGEVAGGDWDYVDIDGRASLACGSCVKKRGRYRERIGKGKKNKRSSRRRVVE